MMPALPHGMTIVPVHSESKERDYLLYAYKNCPKLKEISKQYKQRYAL